MLYRRPTRHPYVDGITAGSFTVPTITAGELAAYMRYAQPAPSPAVAPAVATSLPFVFATLPQLEPAAATPSAAEAPPAPLVVPPALASFAAPRPHVAPATPDAETEAIDPRREDEPTATRKPGAVQYFRTTTAPDGEAAPPSAAAHVPAPTRAEVARELAEPVPLGTKLGLAVVGGVLLATAVAYARAPKSKPKKRTRRPAP
jgi:hypothetical protein